MSDIYVHDIRQTFETLVPNVLDDHSAGKHAARMGGQILEEGVFLGGKLDALASATHLLSQTVDFEIRHAQNLASVGRRTPQERFDPYEQCRENKRFSQVVVG